MKPHDILRFSPLLLTGLTLARFGLWPPEAGVAQAATIALHTAIDEQDKGGRHEILNPSR